MKKHFLLMLLFILISATFTVVPVVPQPTEDYVSVPKRLVEIFITYEIQATREARSGFYNGVFYVATSPAQSDVDPCTTVWSGLVFAYCYKNYEFLQLPHKGKIVNRIGQVVNYLRTSRRGSLWKGEWGAFTSNPISAFNLWFLTQASFAFNETGFAQASIEALQGLQDESGGWGATAEHPRIDNSPKKAYTILALISLLSAKEAGFKVKDEVVRKGLDYLSGKLVKGEDKAYFPEENLPMPADIFGEKATSTVLTSLGLYVFSLAKTWGFDVDENLIMKMKNYVSSKIDMLGGIESPAAILGLTAAASSGVMDTEELKTITEPKLLSEVYRFQSLSDGDILPFNVDLTSLLGISILEWLELTSVKPVLNLDVTPSSAEVSPGPVKEIVKGAEVDLSLTIYNVGPAQLNLKTELISPNLKVKEGKKTQLISLPSGDSFSLTCTLDTSSSNIGEESQLGVKVYKVVEGKELPSKWSKYVKVKIVKDAELVIQKSISNSTARLGSDVKMFVSITNEGDAPAKNVVLKEIIPEGVDVADYMDSPQGVFTDPGYSIPELRAGETVSFNYYLKLHNVKPGKEKISETRITYFNVFEEKKALNNSVSLKVLRPYVVLEKKVVCEGKIEEENVEIGWSSSLDLIVTVSNRGNVKAKGVEISLVVPEQFDIDVEHTDASVSKNMVTWSKNIDPDEEELFKVRLTTHRFYSSFVQEVPLIMDVSYKDDLGTGLEAYSYSSELSVVIKMPLWIEAAIIVVAFLFIGGVGIIAVRKAREKEREERKYRYFGARVPLRKVPRKGKRRGARLG